MTSQPLREALEKIANDCARLKCCTYGTRLMFREACAEMEHEARQALALHEQEGDEIERLKVENLRLNAAMRWEQNRTGRIGTHGANCHLWGHQHYECLVREYDTAQSRVRELEAVLAQALSDHFGPKVGGGDGGTYVVSPMRGETVNRIRALLTPNPSDTEEG